MTEPLPESDNEISLLDIAAAIAQFWVLLLVVPLIVGAVVFAGLNYLQSDRYESNAILNISANEAALLQSAKVVDPALRETNWLSRFDGRMTPARRALLNSLSVQKMENVDYYRAGVVDESPEAANRLLDALIAHLIASSAPEGNDRLSLENRLQTLERSKRDLDASFDRLTTLYDRIGGDPDTTVMLMGDLGQSFATLVRSMADTDQSIFSTQVSLEGSVSESDIVQQPTLPDAPVQNRTLVVAALAAIATGFVLLIFVLIYSGLRNAARDPGSAEKLQQIRSAFRFGKKAV